jgi:carnosine synthase
MPIAVRTVHSDKPSFAAASRTSALASLSGKVIVFVSPGYRGKRFVFDKAHELGVRSVVIDSPGSWTNELIPTGIVEAVLEIDMSSDDDSVFKACVAALSQLPRIDGICTFVELSAPLTARLCERFDVSGHSVSAVAAARDKHLTRKAVQCTPSTSEYAIKNFLISEGTTEELHQAAEHVGFPAVLKPVSGAASLGVQKVCSMEELLTTYHVVSDLVSELIVSSGALERKVRLVTAETDVSPVSPDLFHTNVSSLSNTAIVLEEYICGQEVDIDMVICDGRVTFSEVSDNGPTVEPYFGETYNNCPSLLSKSEQKALEEMAFRIATDALGFKSGVFHIEGKLSSNGPRLIEVNCRMGGGPIRSVHLTRSGVDLVVEQLLIAAGLPAVPDAVPETSRPAIGFLEVNATRSGSVSTIQFLDRFQNRDGMVYCIPFVAVGEHIVGPEEGQPTWLAEVLFTRTTADQASQDSHEMYIELQKLFEEHYV